MTLLIIELGMKNSVSFIIKVVGFNQKVTLLLLVPRLYESIQEYVEQWARVIYTVTEGSALFFFWSL